MFIGILERLCHMKKIKKKKMKYKLPIFSQSMYHLYLNLAMVLEYYIVITQQQN